MNNETKTIFKHNDVIVMRTQYGNFDTEKIMTMKIIIAEELNCEVDEIEVIYPTVPTIKQDLSEIDVTMEGLFDWKDVNCNYITGVELSLKEGSDEYLDAVSSGTLENFLIFN